MYLPSMNPGRNLMLAGGGKLLQDRHDNISEPFIYNLPLLQLYILFDLKRPHYIVLQQQSDISAQGGAYIQHIGSPLPRGMFHVGVTQQRQSGLKYTLIYRHRPSDFSDQATQFRRGTSLTQLAPVQTTVGNIAYHTTNNADQRHLLISQWRENDAHVISELTQILYDVVSRKELVEYSVCFSLFSTIV